MTLLLAVALFPANACGQQPIIIGVLANNGEKAALQRWTPLADYLNREIPELSFQIKPLTFHGVFDKVAGKEMDFVLVNSGLYAELEYYYGVRPVVTLRSLLQNGESSLFSSLIITLAERSEMQDFESLKGKRFAAVDPRSLGGWLMAQQELLRQGIDPERDFSDLQFAGTHRAVVSMVLEGRADAGSIRTGTLESLVELGLIEKEKLRVFHGPEAHFFHGITEENFPFAHSTNIFPEWPLAKMSYTSEELSNRVAVALLNMGEEDEAARKAGIAGWVVARNYQPVHELYRQLRIGPYKKLGSIRFNDVWGKYRFGIMAAGLVFGLILAMLLTLMHLWGRLFKVNKAHKHLAMRDTLTNLPNRILLRDQMLQKISNAERFGRVVGVLFLDLDNFKQINDTFGHNMGDRVLKQVANRLHALVRKGDTVARWGGDEFVLVLDNFVNEIDLASVADNLLQKLSETAYELTGDEVFFSASIGIATFPKNGMEPADLLRHGDTAMYAAKKDGRNCFKFFSEDMHHAAAERHKMEKRLRKALINQEFFLVYQPQVDLVTKKIVGVEALARWQDPAQGVVSPKQFIPVAEETGLIRPLGEWVLQNACSQAVKWQRAGSGPLRISVNLSAKQLRQPDLIQCIEKILSETALDACLLELEITESAIVEKTEEITEVLLKLKKLGIKIAIDDFGTGYSSLSYLKKFPFDRIKIAQEFVRDIPEDPNDVAIVSATIAMAASLGLKTIAEGVETREQFEFLKKQGCREMQGYYFSRPVDSSQMTNLCLLNILDPEERDSWFRPSKSQLPLG